MIDYVPLDTVLTYVSSAIRKEESDDQNILSWALQAYRTISIPARYQTEIQLLPIENHRVELPKGLKQINLVTYMSQNPCNDEMCEVLCARFEDCPTCSTPLNCGGGIYFSDDQYAYCSECENAIVESEGFETRSNNICRHTLSYQLWLQSNVYNNCFTPLSYRGKTKGILCEQCPNLLSGCNDYFTYDVETHSLMVSIESGYVCVDFDSEPKDEKGRFMIPNLPKLLMGLAAYAEAMHMKNRSYMHEENAANMYLTQLRLAESMLKSARGQLLLRGVNLNAIERIQGLMTSHSQLSRVPEFYFAEYYYG